MHKLFYAFCSAIHAMVATAKEHGTVREATVEQCQSLPVSASCARV